MDLRIDRSITVVIVAKLAKSFGKVVFDSIGSPAQYTESLGDFRYSEIGQLFLERC